MPNGQELPRSSVPQSSVSQDSVPRSSVPRSSVPSSSPSQSTEAQGARRIAHTQRSTAQRSSGQHGSYSSTPYSRDVYRPTTQGRKPTQRNLSFPLIPVLAAVLVLGIGAFFIYNTFFSSFTVVVNGQEMKLSRDATAMTLIDEGVVNPTAGNLMAVDGTLISEGEGERAHVTINGEVATPESTFSEGAQVQIADGENTTEDAEVSEEELPFGESNHSTEFGAYWGASIHMLSDGTNGVLAKKTGAISGKHVEEVTVPAIDKGYQVFTVQTDEKVVALTFDDGPWPETTNEVLDVLEENDAVATFFTVGYLVSDGAEQVKRARDMGCEILTHTWDHADGSGQGVNLAYMTAEEQVNEVQQGYAAIKEVTGEEPPHIFRAPGGNFYGEIITNLWPYVDAEIGWNVDTEDWRLPGADSIEAMILTVQPGQVILMHDGGGDRSQTVQALRSALPKLREEGYSFVTISQLLEYNKPQTDGTQT